MVCLEEVQATSERTCSPVSRSRGHSSATKTLPTGLVKPAIPDTSEKGAHEEAYIYLYKTFLLVYVSRGDQLESRDLGEGLGGCLHIGWKVSINKGKGKFCLSKVLKLLNLDVFYSFIFFHEDET